MELEARMATVEKQLVRIETQVEKLASREWVLIDVVQPIKDSVAGIEVSVKSLANEGRELYDAHKEFLKQEAVRREQELEGKTMLGTVKRWAPLLGLLTCLVALFRVLGTLAEVYLKSKGF